MIERTSTRQRPAARRRGQRCPRGAGGGRAAHDAFRAEAGPTARRKPAPWPARSAASPNRPRTRAAAQGRRGARGGSPALRGLRADAAASASGCTCYSRGAVVCALCRPLRRIRPKARARAPHRARPHGAAARCAAPRSIPRPRGPADPEVRSRVRARRSSSTSRTSPTTRSSATTSSSRLAADARGDLRRRRRGAVRVHGAAAALPWGDATIVEAERPRRIVEGDASASTTGSGRSSVYELTPSGRGTRVKLTFESEPKLPSDKFLERLGGRGWRKRNQRKAMRRLQLDPRGGLRARHPADDRRRGAQAGDRLAVPRLTPSWGRAPRPPPVFFCARCAAAS